MNKDDRIKKIAEQVENGTIKVSDLSIDDMFDLGKYLCSELDEIDNQADLQVSSLIDSKLEVIED